MIKNFLNPEGRQNPFSVSKVTAILLKGWIWPIGRVLLGRVCVCSLHSRFSKHRPSGPMLSISRFVRPSACLCVCLFTFEVPFNSLFAPTSWSPMSNIFRDSESLGKSNGQKWSHIWTFLFENCLKSLRKTKKILHFFRSSSVFGLF